MSQIRAIRITETGDPGVLHLETVDLPEPGAGEVRVRHKAIGVNFIDTYHRSGLYSVDVPTGIGLEGAGTIDALGPDVTSLNEGDRVAYCTGPIGAYADLHVIKADRLVRLPDHITEDQAAASMLKGLTVQYLIRQIHGCGGNETVLFHAGAGGVGQLAVQWLRHLGTTIITTVGSAEKADIVRELGADHVILYREEEIAPRVREITGSRGVPVVYDGVGKDTWEASLDSLAPKGLMVSFGNASGPVGKVDLGVLSAKGSLFVTRPTLFTYTDTAQALQAAADDFFTAVREGGVRISEPTVYPLADAAQAHSDLEARKTTGSVILRP